MGRRRPNRRLDIQATQKVREKVSGQNYTELYWQQYLCICVNVIKNLISETIYTAKLLFKVEIFKSLIICPILSLYLQIKYT